MNRHILTACLLCLSLSLIPMFGTLHNHAKASPLLQVEPLSPAGTWHALGDGLNDTVLAIAMVGSDVYIGGQFWNAGGIEEADHIVRWDGAAWHALGPGLTGNVHAIAVSGSDIYVGGRFANAGGDANGDKIARWDGSAWHALGSGLDQYTDTVYAIAVSG
jgi:hypothetical protein